MPLQELFAGLEAVPLPTLTYRTVALLDILGFRQMIASIPLPQLAQRYAAALQGVSQFLREGDDPNEPAELRRAIVCHRFVFSDTIILVSTDETEDAAEDVLFCAWRMAQWFIGGGFPLRGGVAFGEMYADPERQVFLGSALTTAYVLEQRQQWIGVAIDDAVVKKFPRLFPDDPANYITGVLPTYEVPMKDGKRERLRTINWRAQFFAEHGIKPLLPQGEDDSARQKTANALTYAARMRSLGYDYREPYFHRMTPVVITENPRPEARRHGDEY